MKMETSNINGKENYIINGQSIGRAYQQFWREGGIRVESLMQRITDALVRFKYTKRETEEKTGKLK